MQFRSTPIVELVDHMGSDRLICEAARVSTLGSEAADTEESRGLLNFLMKNRHGSPFEHGTMTLRISAPIFVWREFMRHRIGMSYNEQSGRYMELEPLFYLPAPTRPLMQVGKPGAYEFVPGDDELILLTQERLIEAYSKSWDSYKSMLTAGTAKEVARMCLPVAIFSTAYVTMNPRSCMSFLSLRTKSEGSTFPSYPQKEINDVADRIEEFFKIGWPITHEVFDSNGRVSP